MTEKPDPRTRLIADLFHEDWEKGMASDFARSAALQVRRRRVRRRTFLAAALTTGAAAALAILLVRSDVRMGANGNGAVPMIGPAQVQTAAAHPGYEIISDDELIADLRDRPLLILGNKDTGRKFVVLQPRLASTTRQGIEYSQ